MAGLLSAWAPDCLPLVSNTSCLISTLFNSNCRSQLTLIKIKRVGDDYRCQDYFNPVDGDDIPVPHFGLAMSEEQFHVLAKRLKDAGIKFIIKPHLRFKGQPGEQWTMFFKDPSGNNLEFKAMTKIENLFAKYNVVD